MDLTIRFLGLELLSVNLTTDADEEDLERDLSGGTLTGERLGFQVPTSTVEDVPLPQRTPPWDEPE